MILKLKIHGIKIALLHSGSGEKMKLSSKLSIFLSSAIVLFTFNNCAKDSAGSVEESASLEGSLNQYGSGSNTRYASGANANLNPTSRIAVYVSNSLNGPWIENGRTCAGQQTYYKLSGADVSKPIKGCMDLSSNKGCHDLTQHRAYLSSEKVNGDIITSLSAADTTVWPKAEYSFFSSDSPDNNTIVLRKVGFTNIQNCSGVSPSPSAPSCRWTILNLRPVFGGPTAFPPNTVCTRAIAGREEFGIEKVYSSDPGTISEYRYRCDCD